jgi:hypothetical protein
MKKMTAVMALAMITASVAITGCDVHQTQDADKHSNVPEVNDPVDKGLIAMEEKYNTTMPQQINQYSRVDTVKAGHRRLTWYYTLFS